jgi:chaperonin GroEL
VAGGGVAYAKGADILRVTGDSAEAERIVALALYSVQQNIANNAGMTHVIPGTAFDAYLKTEIEGGDMIKVGIIDPANVVISAIRNAVSVACVLLSCDSMIVEKEILNAK